MVIYLDDTWVFIEGQRSWSTGQKRDLRVLCIGLKVTLVKGKRQVKVNIILASCTVYYLCTEIGIDSDEEETMSRSEKLSVGHEGGGID